MSLTDVQEDRLVVSLPEDRYFRLEKSETYAKVKAHALTEVDFGWVKDGEDGLWLMELKDYGENRPSIASAHQKLRNRLPKNIAHAVLLVSSLALFSCGPYFYPLSVFSPFHRFLF